MATAFGCFVCDLGEPLASARPADPRDKDNSSLDVLTARSTAPSIVDVCLIAVGTSHLLLLFSMQSVQTHPSVRTLRFDSVVFADGSGHWRHHKSPVARIIRSSRGRCQAVAKPAKWCDTVRISEISVVVDGINGIALVDARVCRHPQTVPLPLHRQMVKVGVCRVLQEKNHCYSGCEGRTPHAS